MKQMLWIAMCLALIACSQQDQPPPQTQAPVRISVWAHSGQASERETLQDQVMRFDLAHRDIEVRLTFIPESSYNAQVQAAAIAGDLPDVLEFDGPFLYNYVWQGHLQPLDNLLAKPVQDDLLPSIVDQGRYRGKLYAVGTFDSGLGIYARRSLLKKAGARIPTSAAEAWSAEEFSQLLATLAGQDSDHAVLDLKLNYPGEWFTYAFSPLIQSAGGDLIDRSDYQSADGVLNGPEAVMAMTTVQSWFQKGYVDANVDDAAFTSGRVALSWAGHWEFHRYQDQFGDDLVVLPLPDFGRGSRTGQGSWAWGITQNSEHAKAAATFIEFLLTPHEVLQMSVANSAVPATHSAIRQSVLYGENGPLRLFVEQLQNGVAVPRPKTPAYPVITSAFQGAFHDIRNNMTVQAALDKAAATIDQDIRDNRGYPPAND